WMTSVLVWATVVGLMLRVPTWAGIFLCTLTGISFLWFLVCYVYLFARNREPLRAERWRGRSASGSLPDVAAHQGWGLGEGRQVYLGSERAGFAVPKSGADEQPVSVGERDGVRE